MATRAPCLAGVSWLADKNLVSVLALLNGQGGVTRIVGGAVRDALLDRPVGDIDLATTLTPDQVMVRANAAHVKCVPTGIDHGTVTLIAGGQPFEVTTLRRDVRTDGRRATVAYTQDWLEDARRRDFTMNALYADAQGKVFDPLGGYDDLLARHVRFIGEAHARITEDYLRILRFFRFHAQLGRGSLDSQGLAQAGALGHGLAAISRERVRAEMVLILVGRGVLDAVRAMDGAGIFAALDLPAVDGARLTRLVAIEEQPDPMRRLAALVGNPAVNAGILSRKLRLARREANQISRYGREAALTPALGEPDAKAALFRLGGSNFQDCVLFNWALCGAQANARDWRALLAMAQDWISPVFPLTGADLADAGIAPGPEMGAALKRLKDYWVAQDFRPDRAALLAKLRDL